MSTAQVAEYLGITRDVLHARIRAREFKDPDVVIGDRFQGWSPETVEKYRQEHDGFGYSYDTEGLTNVITQIRTIAERVRTYGSQLDNAADGFAWSVPQNLHVIAARLESDFRGRLALDTRNAAHLNSIDVDVASAWGRERTVEQDDTDDQSLIRIALALGPVESYMAADSSHQERMAELHATSDDLSAVIERLPKVFDNPAGRLSARAIAVERSVIDNKLRDLADSA
ncbi:hypothetical protein A5722_31235 [Mycobacterium vulneris]|nr:hypothetical protein A5637_18870 [Mycolicibacterium fortuitum]OBK66326.1 hypothetical protein A5654_18405 [Mycolicibacterium fortuitum]OCB48692.1 hypothetical protein A5721_04940 [Mycolicibacterium vulneris]OCB51336.1 hypothetical protein A5722_31235 [Mycolicibacterium vulneris]OCB68095.1 hypothetical protein A5729_33245 [Mycolicibacterium vulneris]